MDNQNIYIEEGQQTILDAHLAHKLHKQERRLLERLSDAQEAEERALERFQRAQAKLERRKARIRRLEQRISEIRAEQAELPTSAGEPASDYATNGHAPVDALKEDTLLNVATVDTPVPAIDPSAEEVEEDIFEPEVHVTPELLPSQVPALSNEGENTGSALSTAGEAIAEGPAAEVSGDLVPTGTTSTGEELHQDVLQEDVTTEAPALDNISGKSAEEAEMHQLAEPVASGMAAGTTVEMPSALATNEQETPADSEADITTKMEKIDQVEQEEQGEQGEQAKQTEPVPPVEQTEQIAQAEVAQQVPPPKSPEQILIEAREAWQMADAAVHLASNRAQDLAGSISILVQANLSGTLMEELLHKQSEANKALVEARKVARLAYEELVQAEEVYRAAQA